MAAQSPRPDLKKKNDKQTSERPLIEETVSEKPPIEETASEEKPQHEINKTAVIISVVGVVALLFMASR